MEYGKIIAVTGLPGLFELLNSKNDGAIVRSLEDKTTKFVSSRVHNFSHLESIEVFTVRDNVNLVDIFHAMEKEGGKIPDGKDAAELKKYFQKVYGDLDFERVYTSDLKKMAKWFTILKENNIEIKLTEVEESPTEVIEEAPVEKTAPKEKPAAKEKVAEKEPKTTATVKKKPTSEKAAAEESKPAAKKKAAPKEKTSKEEKAPAKKTAAKEKSTSAKATEAKKKAAPKKK